MAGRVAAVSKRPVFDLVRSSDPPPPPSHVRVVRVTRGKGRLPIPVHKVIHRPVHKPRAHVAPKPVVRTASRVTHHSEPVRASVPTSAVKRYAFDLLGATQYACLAHVISKEDYDWDPTKSNYGGSGAYGIPQALPGSKMASAGADWRTNGKTQIKWMVGYVNGRYGSACGAWSYWQAHHSY